MDSNGPPLASVGIFEMTRSQSVQAGSTINGRRGLEDTASAGSTAADELEEGGLVDDGHTQLPGLVQLGPSALAGQQVIGVATDRRGHLAAGLADHRRGLVAAEGGQGSGQNPGLAGDRP